LHHLDGRDNDRFVGWLLAGDWLNPQTCPPGLYSGTAGIAWVLDELGYPELAFTAMSAATDHPLVHADPGILSGTAGIGMGCLRLSRRASDPALAERALDWALMCGRWLRRTAIIDERGAHWPVNRSLAMAVEAPAQPVGYSNGASGIALFLLYLAQATGDQAWFRLGRQALDHDLSWAWSFEADFVQFPGVTHDPGGQPKVTRTYWDEGTAGVATTLLRYRVMADDDALRAAWERMRPDLCRKYVVLPQLFHGLAGIGMALQDAAELIGDAQAGLEARRLAGGLAMYAVPREDGIAWPSEQCFRESSDLATGAAGIAMFLQRLRSPVAGSSSNLNFIVDELIEGQRRR
jgi:lantibiotic modifying enzyme